MEGKELRGMKEGSKSHKIILQNCCWICSVKVHVYTTPSSHSLYSELSHVQLFCSHVCCYLQHQQVSLRLLRVQKKNYIAGNNRWCFKCSDFFKKTDRGACFILQATVRLKSCPTSHSFRVILQIFALLYKVYPGKSREQQVGNSNKSLGFYLLYKTTNIRYLLF